MIKKPDQPWPIWIFWTLLLVYALAGDLVAKSGRDCSIHVNEVPLECQ